MLKGENAMAYVKGINYFEMFVELIGFSNKAATEFKGILQNYDVSRLEEQLATLHDIEHTADMHIHKIKQCLADEFITPIEREDILQIAGRIDDITDSIEDVLQKLYMFNIKKLRPEAVEFMDILLRCCEELRKMFTEFHNFKKSKTLHTSIVEVNKLEEEGDRLYMKAMRRLFSDGESPADQLPWSQIFYQLEKCCDTCEDAADIVEGIIMTNS